MHIRDFIFNVYLPVSVTQWWLTTSVVHGLVPYPKSWSKNASHVVRTIHPASFELVTNSTYLIDGIRKRIQNWFRLPDDFIDYPVNPLDETLQVLSQLHVSIVEAEEDLTDHTMAVVGPGVDESYHLSIPLTGPATIQSQTVVGALRGMVTFAQLLDFGWIQDDGQSIFVLEADQVIQDKPTYSYRGLLVDTSRHFLPMGLLMTNLDAMEMNKLNVLHWHMTDSQSWPYQSLAFPELSERGAYRHDMVYAPGNVRRIVQEAYYRGIQVIPEFDLPGHSYAIGKSHPEFMAHCPDWNEPIDPTKDIVWDFIEKLYNEIFTLFPSDMVHLGGDEVLLDCWKNDSSIQAWMRNHGVVDEVEMFELFEKRLLDIVEPKRPIVWQEVFDLGINISQHTIVDAWKDWDNQDVYAIGNATARGFDVIVSSCWYLDHEGQDWFSYYQCDPRSKCIGSEEQKSHVVGGHASMWGERVDSTVFMSRVWPRASAAAERLWTGVDKTAEATVKDRMTDFRCRMVQSGIDAGPIDPGVCPKEPRARVNHVRNVHFLNETGHTVS